MPNIPGISRNPRLGLDALRPYIKGATTRNVTSSTSVHNNLTGRDAAGAHPAAAATVDTGALSNISSTDVQGALAQIDALMHAAATAGDGIDVTGQAIAVDVTDIIDTSYGLTESSNNIRVSLAATSGLNFSTGALLVGAGDGIDVLTNTIAVDVTDILGSGLTESSNNIDLNWGTPTIGTIEPDDAASAGSTTNPARSDHQHAIAAAAGVTLTVASTNTEGAGSNFARSTHTHAITTSASPGAAASILASSAAGYLTLVRLNTDTIGDRSGGDLTILPTGDLVLDPVGDQVRIGPTNEARLQSNDYASQTTGWGISYAGGADFRYLFADELHVKSFIADLEQALAGGQIICKSVAILSRLFTAPAASGAVTLYVWDLPSAAEMAVFESGDIVCLRGFSRAAGSLSVSNCWGVVTSYSNLTLKEQSWTFTRSAAPNAGAMAESATVDPDAIVLDYGTTGNGYYEVNAIDGAYAENSPYAQIVTWATHPATGKTVRTRLGNLYGVTTETEYGLYAGDGVGAGDSYIRLTDVNFELHNIDFAMYDDGNVQRIGMDAGASSANALMWAGPSSSDKRFIVYGDGTVWLSTLAISESAGQSLFSQADGLLLLSPYYEKSPTSWVSTRGQTATIGGAFHEVAGRWAESRALMVEDAATNLVENPSVEVDTTYYTLAGAGTTITRITTDAVRGDACLEVVVADVAGAGVVIHNTTRIPVDASSDYTFTAYLRVVGEPSYAGQLGITWRDAGGGVLSTSTQAATITNGWLRYQITAESPATAAFASPAFTRAGTGVHTYHLDAVQFEKSAFATSYIDGSLGTGYAWTGTAHASTSTRAATTANLDAHCGLLSDNNTVSFALWIQAQYDADDANWPCGANQAYIMDYRGADNANRTLLRFYPAGNYFAVFISAGDRLGTAAQTFVAGDWIHIVITLDYTADSYAIYVNGAVADTDTTALTAPTAVVDWALGPYTLGAGYSGGWALDEYAVFDRVLTAEEVASIYASNSALTDMGAFNKPGLYILDGQIDLRTSMSGARVQIDTDGISAYSATAVQTVGIETDGDAFFGSDISAPATTTLAVFANAQTYNSEAVTAGDVLLGDNSASKANLLWDVSEGDLKLREGIISHIILDGSAGKLTIGEAGTRSSRVEISGGLMNFIIVSPLDVETTNMSINATGVITVGQVAASQNNVLISSGAISIRNNTTAKIALTAAGILTIGEVAANQNNVLISSGAISIRNNTTERIGMTAAGILTIKDSGGAAVITLDASAGAEITKKLTMPGANSAISIGGTPPTAVDSGTGIWIDRTGIYDLWSDVWITKIDATDGKFYAAKGLVWIDGDGASIRGEDYTATADANTVKWEYDDSGTDRRLGYVYGDYYPTAWFKGSMWMVAKRETDDPWTNGTVAIVAAIDNVDETDVRLNVDSNGTISSTGATHIVFQAPVCVGQSASAPTVGVQNGMIYYNTSTHNVVARINGAWQNLY